MQSKVKSDWEGYNR